MDFDNAEIEAILHDASSRSIRYLEDLQDRSVAPTSAAVEGLSALDTPLPEQPADPIEVLELLDRVGSPATMGSAGPRYFGFVVGGSLPVTLAANWLAGAWDQNAPARVLSPAGAAFENTAMRWVVELLGLPEGTWGGLVSGATEANFTGLAAARQTLLKRKGWDLTEEGIFGAPELRAVVGEEVHVSAMKALRLLGFGRDRQIRVPVDEQGRMRADALPELDSSTIVCIQAGNVNSGAFDPADEICARATAAGAWVHVDGAFGLWTMASPNFNQLTEGISKANSWATDAHKWLNVPYDCGIAFCRDPEDLANTMALDPAGYIPDSEDRDPGDFTMPMSRRARGVEVWTALRALGRAGVVELIERTSQHARLFARKLSEAGYSILNEVVINQVLVDFGNDTTTERVIEGVQADGTCWMGGTTWHGKKAMRISVSSWATTTEDVERSVEAILKVASSAP